MIILNSCSADNDQNITQTSRAASNVVVKKISLSDVYTIPQYAKARSLMPNPIQSSLKRKAGSKDSFIYDEKYSLYIDAENGRYIESDGFHSYSFQVRRDQYEDKLENIVFNYSKKNDAYETYIVQYNVSPDKAFLIENDKLPNLEKKYFKY